MRWYSESHVTVGVSEGIPKRREPLPSRSQERSSAEKSTVVVFIECDIDRFYGVSIELDKLVVFEVDEIL